MEATGGEKLGRALESIAQKLGAAQSVKVGFLEGSTEASGVSIPLISAIQEFGAPSKGIPPRPYFRSMINKHAAEWPREVMALLKTNDYDASASLDQLGFKIAIELQQSIIDTNAPPLSPVTVMMRGMRGNKQYDGKPFWELFAIAKDRVAKGKTNYGASTKPLVDTGTLLNSVDHIVT